jgi:hypothetical protein
LRERGIEFGYESEVLEYKSRVRNGICGDGECDSAVYQKRKYTPDFIFMFEGLQDDSKLYVEAKGRFTSKDKSKMRAVKATHPDKDIRFLFQKRSKKEMAIVGTWCIKNDFPFAFGTVVPEDWL